MIIKRWRVRPTSTRYWLVVPYVDTIVMRSDLEPIHCHTLTLAQYQAQRFLDAGFTSVGIFQLHELWNIVKVPGDNK